jgi:hypothetical protein
MATRMQQRRGTASQWTSANPILNAGEMGWESDTNKFKIGDGTNHWADLDYFIDVNSTVNPAFGSSITFEGATANNFETTLAITDPTADRTITFPDATGTVVLADGSGNVTVSGDLTVSGTTTTINSTTINATTGIVFEGLTADAHETTLTVTDPTADRTITFPDATGTVQLRVTDVSDTEIGYLNGVTSAIQTQLDDKSTASKTETFTNKSISLGSNTVTSTLAQLNTAISDADVASLTGTETLTNKTLTSPVVSGLTLSDSGIVFEGSSADAHETTLTVTNPTEDRTLTLPNSTGTIATQEYVDSSVSGAEVDQSTLAGTGISWNAGTSKFDVDTATIQARVTDVTDTEIGYLNGVTSAIQTQMDAKAPLADPAFTGTATAVNLTVSGNLTVDGTTTNINSTNLVVEDKNIVLGDTASPTDTTADGGGITLKGATDKTFNWVDATDAWTSSEHVNLASGKTLKYNGTDLVASQSGNSGKYLTTDGTSTSWGTISGYSAPTLGSTSIASGATVTTISGLADIVLNGPGSVTDELTLLLMGAI